jgi:putative ABC transport system permease protein
MVLQESIFITTISGYIGLFMGVMLLSSIGDSLEEDFYIIDPYVDLYTALLATLMLIVFGGIAGFIPAKKASNIKPIEALNDK